VVYIAPFTQKQIKRQELFFRFYYFKARFYKFIYLSPLT